MRGDFAEKEVVDKKATEGNFTSYYDQLVKYIAPGQHAVRIITDGFWAKENVNRLIEEYASEKKYPLRMIEQRIWFLIKDYFDKK